MNSSSNIIPVVIVALVLWLSGLSAFFYWMVRHYKRLARKTKEGNIIKALNTVLDLEQENKKSLAKVESQINEIIKNARGSLQKVGLVRFNPFNETGGDQSFSISVLDADDNGFVITGLHTRDRTRVYTKPVKKGESKYGLSKEEKKAVAEAKK